MKLTGLKLLFQSLVLMICIAGFLGPAWAANPISGSVASMYVLGDKVEWEPNEEYDGLTLTVTGPNDTVYTHDSNGREIIVFFGEDNCGNSFPDGPFTYELSVSRELSQEEMTIIAAARISCESLGVEAYKTPLVQSGMLLMKSGEIVYALPEGESDFPSGDPIAGRPAAKDYIINDDLLATYSQCIGFHCSNGMSFGYDTLVLKEHNLRILFNDTSTISSFPTNSWRIEINSKNNGGGSYFAIQDVDEGTTPFKIEAKAPNSSLYLDDNGRVGFGTSAPVLELHVKDGDTPSLRLHQDASYGWDAQTWDISGNESNFFIRDATNGSKLPFRIQPGAPSSSLTIRSTGHVGMGTWSPSAKLHVKTTSSSTDPVLLVERELSAGTQAAYLKVKDSGDVEIFKTLGESSDRNQKKNITPVDTAATLKEISTLKLATWSYKTDDDSTVHMGPMAQDFYAAFGLGSNNKHISAIDSSGVALAAIKELYILVEKQNEIIRDLQQKCNQLEARQRFNENGQTLVLLNKQ